MNTQLGQGRIDHIEIEREARRMQAEAVAQSVRSMRNWVRGALRRRPVDRTI